LTLPQTTLPKESIEQDENWKIDEWLRCQQSPQHFLQTYGKVRDEQEGIIPWSDWDYLTELLEIFLNNREVIILKARQLGVSTLIAGYCLWKAIFYEGASILLLSQQEKKAGQLLAKCKVIWEFLPPYLRPKLGKDQESALTFPSMHSSIDALASTEDAGRSVSASIVVCDEWEYHPYDRTNYGAIRPTIGAGGQFIALSTADSENDKTLFKEIYHRAQAGKNSFKRKFLAWNLRPGRDEAWLAKETENMPDWQKKAEYPSTEREALETLKTRPFFDPDALETMYPDCLNPIEHEISDKFNTIKIFRLPEPGVLYCLFTDPSYGREDPHATIVIKVATGEQVAESHGKLPAERVAEVHDALARLYNNAFNSFELNAEVGNIMRETLESLKTPNQAPFIKPDGKTDPSKKGWWTGKQTKPKMLWGLEEAIRLRQIIPRSKECLDEMGWIVLPEGEEPRTKRGMHDDYTMAWAGVWQIKKYTPRPTSAKFKSWTRRDTTY